MFGFLSQPQTQATLGSLRQQAGSPNVMQSGPPGLVGTGPGTGFQSMMSQGGLASLAGPPVGTGGAPAAMPGNPTLPPMMSGGPGTLFGQQTGVYPVGQLQPPNTGQLPWLSMFPPQGMAQQQQMAGQTSQAAPQLPAGFDPTQPGGGMVQASQAPQAAPEASMQPGRKDFSQFAATNPFELRDKNRVMDEEKAYRAILAMSNNPFDVFSA